MFWAVLIYHFEAHRRPLFMDTNLHKTPLYEKHVENGAQMAPFMGCLMPAHYADTVREHLAVRTAAVLLAVRASTARAA